MDDMKEMRNGERIAVLESQFTDIKQELTNVRTDIKALSLTTDKVLAAKITDHTKIEMEVSTMKEEIKEIKGNRTFWNWFSPTMSAIISAIITYLFVSYLQNLHH